MDPAEYDKLDRLEDRMWWFAATHANLMMLAQRFGSSAAPRRILDAGCGTGGLLAKLAAAGEASTVVGLDADESACARARSAAVRSMRCPLSTRHFPRSSAPMCCAIAMSMSGKRSSSFAAASRQEAFSS
jgi:SAM-dependent methyltransferase